MAKQRLKFWTRTCDRPGLPGSFPCSLQILCQVANGSYLAAASWGVVKVIARFGLPLEIWSISLRRQQLPVLGELVAVDCSNLILRNTGLLLACRSQMFMQRGTWVRQSHK